MNCKHCGLEIIVDNYKWSSNHKGYKHVEMGYNKCCNAKRGHLIDDDWAEPNTKEENIIKLLCAVDTVTDL